MQHEAYVISAPANIQVQIESIASYDSFVVIGTRVGRLFVYQIKNPPHSSPADPSGAAVTSTTTTDTTPTTTPSATAVEPTLELELVHCNKNFAAGRPVRQLECIAEHQLLFALCNDTVGVYSMLDHNRDYPLVHAVAAAKGATLFALNISRSRSLDGDVVLAVRMVVAVKRKLQLWYWKKTEFLRLPQPDIDLADVPRALQWSGDTIVVGLKAEYLYFDLSDTTPVKHNLFPTGSAADCDPCIVPINDYFAVAKDEVLIAVQPVLSVSAAAVAAAGGGEPPSGLSIGGSSGSSFASAQQLQADAVADTLRSFVWSQPIQQFVWDEPYVVALTRDAIEVRVKTTDAERDTLIQTLPNATNRGHVLLQAGGGRLLVASRSTFWTLQAVDIVRQRQQLLAQKRFHLALKLTDISAETAEEKLERRNYIQTAHAYDLFARRRFKESMDEFAELKTDPCDVIRLFPGLLPAASSSSGTVGDSTPTSPLTPEAAIRSVPLEGRDLEAGLVALSAFLTDARYHVRDELTRHRKDTNDSGASTAESKRYGKNLLQLQSIIDTTLLKCYLQTNDSLVSSLIRSGCCHFDESERVLRQHRKLGELKLLYEQNGHHRQALQLLQAESAKPNSKLAGHEQTVQYLLQLGPAHKGLIFEFASWVLRQHPDDGMAVFTDDAVRVDGVRRADVLDYLLREHRGLVVQYLEHIIGEWQETKAIFHDILIKQYLQTVRQLQTSAESGEGRGAETKNADQSAKERTAALAAARHKLITFLRDSAHYNGDSILNELPHNALFEERAVVLGKLGFHDKCLAIYIQILGDLDAAAAYANRVYTADPDNDSIYVTLVEMLLTVPAVPPYGGVALHERCLQPNTEFVLRLLDEHATRFNAQAVLKVLPGTVPLERLRGFMEQSLVHLVERQHRAQVLKSLIAAVSLQQQEQLAELRAQSVRLTELVVCTVCNKRFANQSACVRLTDGRVVHYSCQWA